MHPHLGAGQHGFGGQGFGGQGAGHGLGGQGAGQAGFGHSLGQQLRQPQPQSADKLKIAAIQTAIVASTIFFIIQLSLRYSFALALDEMKRLARACCNIHPPFLYYLKKN